MSREGNSSSQTKWRAHRVGGEGYLQDRPVRTTLTRGRFVKGLVKLSTELPAIAALEAEYERGHGLVGGPSLELCVRAVLLSALSALEHVRRSA